MKLRFARSLSAVPGAWASRWIRTYMPRTKCWGQPRDEDALINAEIPERWKNLSGIGF